MRLADLSPLANHLWQSTLFVALVWLLSSLLKRNRAAVRYRLWMVASMKFLIPFAALVAIGHQFEWESAGTITQPDVTLVIHAISVPFSRPELTTGSPPLTTSLSLAAVLPILLSAIWFGGCVMHFIAWRGDFGPGDPWPSS